MKHSFAALALLALIPGTVLGATCNADNCLRALRRRAAEASLFCSTYTTTTNTATTALPTYASSCSYSASRLSSACTCLSTPPPSPTYVCNGDLIANGDFSTLTRGKPEPWILAPPTSSHGQSTSATVQTFDNNNYVVLSVSTVPGAIGTTYFSQAIPGLCYGITYTFTYTSQLSIGGGSPSASCRVYYNLNDRNLVTIGPPSDDIPPFSLETRSMTFEYYEAAPSNKLTITLSCVAPSGSYKVTNVSLVGEG